MNPPVRPAQPAGLARETGGLDGVAITLDIDWAPDFAIDAAAEALIRKGVRATWFVTHDSPAVWRLRRHPDLFELGIHPNYLPGSSHGTDPLAVLRACMELVPDAVSMRTHGLVQSTALLELALESTPVRLDASLFLPHAPGLRPIEYHWKGRALLRVPYFWEDDFEMYRPEPRWTVAPLLTDIPGLKVFDFHPIHIALNSREPGAYEALRHRVASPQAATPVDVAACAGNGPGAGTLFLELVEHVSGTGGSGRLVDLEASWRSARDGHGQ